MKRIMILAMVILMMGSVSAADIVVPDWASLDGYGVSAGDVIGSIDYSSCGESHTGDVTVYDLKASQKYQLKLNGKPSCVYGDDGDDTANENIGFAGRWWCKTGCPVGCAAWGCNIDDAYYNANKAEPGFCAEGYLLYECITTDANGDAGPEAFDVDYSYHVCGVSERGPISLPEGDYDARFFLTEEGGNWPTIGINDDIVFEISDSCQEDDIPEFTTIGAGLVLLGAGLFAYKKRK